MSKDYNHVIKNKVLPGGKLISDYQIMTGQGLTDLEMLSCFIRKNEFKFDYQDLSEEVKNIIPIRKKYRVYTKEDDMIVQEIKYYFMGIHFLLKELDSL